MTGRKIIHYEFQTPWNTSHSREFFKRYELLLFHDQDIMRGKIGYEANRQSD